MAQQEAVPVYQRGMGIETFYVPAFEIKIQGRGLPRDVVRDVMQVTYKDGVNDIDFVELTINNWDAAARNFKYVGLDDKDLNPNYKGIFNPGQELEVRMGYQQPLAGDGDQPQLKLMMRGQITGLDQDFPNAGNPTLQVHVLNILHRFRKTQHTWTWENMRDSDIAHELGQKPVSEDKPGLGIEVRIDEEAADDETSEPVVFMHSQYDIVFLLERARRHGYTLYLDEELKNGRVKQFLYFGRSDRDTFATYKLEWGKSLIQFHPTLTTANQVLQVKIRGWDRRSKRPIEETATWGDTGVRINLDLKELVQKELEGRQEVVTNKPVYTPKEARAMAKDLLLNHLKEMLKASGSTVGLPELRAGRTVQIGGLGKYFSGTYYVIDTTHTIGNDGYRTTFNARREEES